MAKNKNVTAEPKVIATRPADENHRVLTIVGGNGGYCKQPCPQCPWRMDQVGNFPAEAFRISANTAYDMSGHTFACHMAGKDNPTICAGFLLGAHHNMAVRMKCIAGEIDPREVSDGGNELYETYRDMAIANGVDEDDPAIRGCR